MRLILVVSALLMTTVAAAGAGLEPQRTVFNYPGGGGACGAIVDPDALDFEYVGTYAEYPVVHRSVTFQYRATALFFDRPPLLLHNMTWTSVVPAAAALPPVEWLHHGPGSFGVVVEGVVSTADGWSDRVFSAFMC